MKLSSVAGMLIALFLLPLNMSLAAEQGVFKNRSLQQHGLKKWEADKIKAEFRDMYNRGGGSTAQKLNGNPWEAKRARMKQRNQKALQQNNTWGGCREYAYKMRGQCYARGGDAYTCERYYDARVHYCNAKFK
ncbi:hypothetical protein MNBD_GAMMA11-1523 [hydrothermal vent metagenome]|uniref:Uncharacterized protein n=1 Tax=hydrothermal vent metagenome TaxID=652676 RepID=A0A3B0X575_9ZZZZ